MTVILNVHMHMADRLVPSALWGHRCSDIPHTIVAWKQEVAYRAKIGDEEIWRDKRGL